ncbi:MAG: VanZ family protein [Pseudomonadota bacterium]|nr:VanZ family protein [Pseudomonadota bacterium]
MLPIISLLVLDPKLRKWRWGCALTMYVTILVMGSVPGARAQIGHYATGVVLHSLAYAILTALVYTGSTGSAGVRALKAVLTVALMGAGDELLQSLFPYRGAAVNDWLVDCAAAIITATVLSLLLPKPALARPTA